MDRGRGATRSAVCHFFTRTLRFRRATGLGGEKFKSHGSSCLAKQTHKRWHVRERGRRGGRDFTGGKTKGRWSECEKERKKEEEEEVACDKSPPPVNSR